MLFWDEPEANLNPRLFGPLIDILIGLNRLDVQIFIATHDYAILKQLDLRTAGEVQIAFHALYHDEASGEIRRHTAAAYRDIHPNAIAETFADLYDREVKRSLGDFGT